MRKGRECNLSRIRPRAGTSGTPSRVFSIELPPAFAGTISRLSGIGGAPVKAAFRFPFRELVSKGYFSDQHRKKGNVIFVGVSCSELVRFAGYI